MMPNFSAKNVFQVIDPFISRILLRVLTSYFSWSPLISATWSSSKPSTWRTVSKYGKSQCIDYLWARCSSHNACLMKKAFSKTLLQKPPSRLTFMVCIPGKIIEKFTCNEWYEYSREGKETEISRFMVVKWTRNEKILHLTLLITSAQISNLSYSYGYQSFSGLLLRGRADNTINSVFLGLKTISRVIQDWFVFRYFLWFSKDSRHFLNQSDSNLKPTASWLLAFSRALRNLHVLTLIG